MAWISDGKQVLRAYRGLGFAKPIGETGRTIGRMGSGPSALKQHPSFSEWRAPFGEFTDDAKDMLTRKQSGPLAMLKERLSGAHRTATISGLSAKYERRVPNEDGATILSARHQLNAIINLKAVDLAYSYDDYGCSPAGSLSTEKKKHYPSLFINDRADDIDLPLSGTATVKYKMRSKTTRQDGDGKQRHSADIEIQSIDPIEEVKAKATGAATPIKMAANLQSPREQLDGIIMLARGDFLLKRIAQSGGKVALPMEQASGLIKAVKGNTLGYMADAKRIGGVSGNIQTARDHIAQQIRGVRAQGMLKPGGAVAPLQQAPGAFGRMASTASSAISGAVGGVRSAAAAVGSRFAGAASGFMDRLRKPDASAAFNYRSKLRDIIELSDPRPRNPLGEFNGGGGMPGSDPTAIHQAYKVPQMMAQEQAAMSGLAGKLKGKKLKF